MASGQEQVLKTPISNASCPVSGRSCHAKRRDLGNTSTSSRPGQRPFCYGEGRGSLFFDSTVTRCIIPDSSLLVDTKCVGGPKTFSTASPTKPSLKIKSATSTSQVSRSSRFKVGHLISPGIGFNWRKPKLHICRPMPTSKCYTCTSSAYYLVMNDQTNSCNGSRVSLSDDPPACAISTQETIITGLFQTSCPVFWVGPRSAPLCRKMS